MIAQAVEHVEVTRDVWQSLLVVGGGLVTASIALSVLARVPGGRILFAFLVRDPLTRWIDRTMERKTQDWATAQTEVTRRAIEKHVTESLAPIVRAIDDINNAVNNVEPGTDPIKTRVAKHGEELAALAGKVDTILTLMREGRE